MQVNELRIRDFCSAQDGVGTVLHSFSPLLYNIVSVEIIPIVVGFQALFCSFDFSLRTALRKENFRYQRKFRNGQILLLKATRDGLGVRMKGEKEET